MVNIEICGIDVEFPFEPYECQTKYMEKVIQCLQRVMIFILDYIKRKLWINFQTTRMSLTFDNLI